MAVLSVVQHAINCATGIHGGVHFVTCEPWAAGPDVRVQPSANTPSALSRSPPGHRDFLLILDLGRRFSGAGALSTHPHRSLGLSTSMVRNPVR